MVSFSCIILHLRRSIPWIGILVTFSLLSAISGYGFLFSVSTITSFILTFSTIFFTFSKPKAVLLLLDEPKEEEQEEEVVAEGDDKLQESPAAGLMSNTTTATTTITTEQQPKMETFSQDYRTVNLRSRDLLYSETHDDQSYSSSSYQDSDDMDLLVDDDQSPTDCSDDSISDEESLIEIALPSGIYVGSPKKHHQENHHHHHHNHDTKVFKQQKFPAPPPPPPEEEEAEAVHDDNLDQSLIFHHHHHQGSFMELLAEINDMNEEENLIEIDLSMGSIKCSRFQIQQA